MRDTLNWEQIEREVVERIRALALVEQSLADDELGDAIFRDLVVPAAKLLASFCSTVEIEIGGAEG